MCIQAGHSMISPEKMCINVTLRANLSNGSWILSFRYQFSIGAIYEIVLFMSFFIFVAWFGWVGKHQAVTFTWPSWKPNILVLIFENTQNQKKNTNRFFSTSLDPESHSDMHPKPSDHMWHTEFCMLLSAKSHYEARQLPLIVIWQLT